MTIFVSEVGKTKSIEVHASPLGHCDSQSVKLQRTWFLYKVQYTTSFADLKLYGAV